MSFLDSFLGAGGAVTWILLPAFVANALATLPRGAGPPMDLGRRLRSDGERILGPSKTWSGFLAGGAAGTAVGLLEAWLILLAPPSLALVPRLAPSVLLAVPLVLLVAYGAMTGDALGSFVKRRLKRPSGTRAVLLDQFPFVLVPIALGFAFFPALFFGVFVNGAAVVWLVGLTLGLHTLFNWIGFKAGLKKVPW